MNKPKNSTVYLELGVVIALIGVVVGAVIYLERLQSRLEKSAEEKLAQIKVAGDNAISQLTNCVYSADGIERNGARQMIWGSIATDTTGNCDVQTFQAEFAMVFSEPPTVLFSILPEASAAQGSAIKDVVVTPTGMTGRIYIQHGDLLGHGRANLAKIRLTYLAVGKYK